MKFGTSTFLIVSLILAVLMSLLTAVGELSTVLSHIQNTAVNTSQVCILSMKPLNGGAPQIWINGTIDYCGNKSRVTYNLINLAIDVLFWFVILAVTLFLTRKLKAKSTIIILLSLMFTIMISSGYIAAFILYGPSFALALNFAILAGFSFVLSALILFLVVNITIDFVKYLRNKFSN